MSNIGLYGSSREILAPQNGFDRSMNDSIKNPNFEHGAVSILSLRDLLDSDPMPEFPDLHNGAHGFWTVKDRHKEFFIVCELRINK